MRLGSFGREEIESGLNSKMGFLCGVMEAPKLTLGSGEVKKAGLSMWGRRRGGPQRKRKASPSVVCKPIAPHFCGT